jgi:hypothetical protein
MTEGARHKLSFHDWNFDAVPDSELVACCYWEYARESAFIRNLKQRCGDGKWKDMHVPDLWTYVGKDIEQIQSIGYPAEAFLSGFFFDEQDRRPSHPDAPRITGSFPNAWQTLSIGEREDRSRIRNDVEMFHLRPFKRAHWGNAWDLMERAKARQREVIEADDRPHRQHPGVSDYYLRIRNIFEYPPDGISVFWAGDNDEPNKEVTMVEIEWARFTNEQIVQSFRKWVAANRPTDVNKPDNRGHKPKDWREHLIRLGVLRLLSQFTALQIVDPRQDKIPAVWETKQFAGRKWRDVTKWHDARREAAKVFHTLFPFLSKDEKPISWNRRPPAK